MAGNHILSYETSIGDNNIAKGKEIPIPNNSEERTEKSQETNEPHGTEGGEQTGSEQKTETQPLSFSYHDTIDTPTVPPARAFKH